MANAFGIAVPGGDGRAGMVALVLVDPRAFDGAAFYAFVSERLPAYAAPVFVRLQGEADVTGTFKLRKVDLAKEGYDPAVVKDPLWLRDDSARAYVELTPDRYAAVQSGRVRL
jgi:fatty-acyl-CoA synthase